MGSATAHGYPYPVGTDRVMDGDNAIQALAEKVDARLAGGVSSVGIAVDNIPSNAGKNVAVTFPVGVFTVPPFVATGIDTGNPSLYLATVANLAASGCTVCTWNYYSAPMSIFVYLVAHQPT